MKPEDVDNEFVEVLLSRTAMCPKYWVTSDYKHFIAAVLTVHAERNPPSELETLRNAIRKHRDQRGDDRCWMDDEELYKALPEGYTPPERDTCVMLENCRKFIESRQNPATEYVSPEREIERLREPSELERLIGELRKLEAEGWRWEVLTAHGDFLSMCRIWKNGSEPSCVECHGLESAIRAALEKVKG